MEDAREAAADHEYVYELLYHEQWSELIDFVHRHRDSVSEDSLLEHAVDVFTQTFFERLSSSAPDQIKPELEKLFLLHSGGFYRLEPQQFEQVVVSLVALHEHHPETAAGYARHSPENDRCAEVLRRYDVRRQVDHDQSDRISVATTQPAESVDHTVGLFKSRQEVAFYMAVREVFATYFVYPNVALSSTVDFDRVRDTLSSAERTYFFRASVDCVVFDQHGDYRPVYFFELDSPLHDDVERKMNDGMKDRILSAAGRELHRVRVRDRRSGRREFVRLLQELIRSA